LGIFAMMEFSKTPTAQTLASRVLIVVPMWTSSWCSPSHCLLVSLLT
jgi:hypothetical protein